jgi:hypothetical protein
MPADVSVDSAALLCARRQKAEEEHALAQFFELLSLEDAVGTVPRRGQTRSTHIDDVSVAHGR